MNWTCEHPHPLPSTVTREPWPRSAGRPQRNDAGGRERTLGYDDHDDAGGGKTAIILIGLHSPTYIHDTWEEGLSRECFSTRVTITFAVGTKGLSW